MTQSISKLHNNATRTALEESLNQTFSQFEGKKKKKKKVKTEEPTRTL
jgi:hypothetical protein